MSIVNIRNIEFLNNPAKFTDPYRINIEFESIAELQDDLEWRLTYVGSAASDEFDQELDSVMVGPVPVGNNTFEFNADPPSLARLPAADNTTSSLGPPVADLIGVTVLILSALYKDKEFVRVGYYVASNWETSDYGLEVEEGRRTGELDKIVRTVEIGQPRVTRFANSWDNPEDDVPTASTSSAVPTSLASSAEPVDPLSSALPPPLSAAPLASSSVSAPSESSAPAGDSTGSGSGGTGSQALGGGGLAAAAEEEDRLGKQRTGDVGRGEEAGEGLATTAGAALNES